MNRILLNPDEFLVHPAPRAGAYPGDRKVVVPRMAQVAPVKFAWGNVHLTAEETAGFLRIVESASRVSSHYELFALLQAEFQRFVPHQILISAWGHFDHEMLGFDVVSALPGVRTGLTDGARIEPLVRDLFARWAENGRRPILLQNAVCAPGNGNNGDACALDMSLRNMKSVLLHGIHDARDNSDSLYFALNPHPITRGRCPDDFSSVVELLVSQIHVAFQKVAPLASARAASGSDVLARLARLSPREQEVLKWVAEGKTNNKIAEILGVSQLTIKNHVQHILRKLGATNRIEAVTRYRDVFD